MCKFVRFRPAVARIPARRHMAKSRGWFCLRSVRVSFGNGYQDAICSKPCWKTLEKLSESKPISVIFPRRESFSPVVTGSVIRLPTWRTTVIGAGWMSVVADISASDGTCIVALLSLISFLGFRLLLVSRISLAGCRAIDRSLPRRWDFSNSFISESEVSMASRLVPFS